MILKSDSGLFDVLVGKSQDLWGEKIKQILSNNLNYQYLQGQYTVYIYKGNSSGGITAKMKI